MKAIPLAILAGLCWGVGELCTKMVLQTHRIGPVTAIAVRSTIALPVLWIAYAIAVHQLGSEPRGWLRALEPGDLARLVIGSGLVAGAGGMLCFYAALHLDDISRIKPIAFTVAPAVAVLLGWWLLGEPMSLRKGLAVALILIGVGLLTTGAARSAPVSAPVETAGGSAADSG
jgi:transporter family protein